MSLTTVVALFICVAPLLHVFIFFPSAVKGRKLISYFYLENKGNFFHKATAVCR